MRLRESKSAARKEGKGSRKPSDLGSLNSASPSGWAVREAVLGGLSIYPDSTSGDDAWVEETIASCDGHGMELGTVVAVPVVLDVSTLGVSVSELTSGHAAALGDKRAT